MCKESRFKVRSENTERRNKAILADYKKFYDVDRIRHDDCIQKLADKYFLSEGTISSILSKTD